MKRRPLLISLCLLAGIAGSAGYVACPYIIPEAAIAGAKAHKHQKKSYRNFKKYTKQEAIAELQKRGKITSEADISDDCLVTALVDGDAEILSLLLDAGGGDVSANTSYLAHSSAGPLLHFAAKEGKAECVHMLLKAGADANSVYSSEGVPFTALGHAATEGQEECFHLLMKANPSEDTRKNALELACHDSLQSKKSLQRKIRFIKELLKSGVNAKGTKALQNACKSGAADFIPLLLQSGADIKEGPVLTWNLASENRVSPQLIQLLLEKGADINAKHEYKGDAMGLACSKGCNSSVKLLLAAGAEINALYQASVYNPKQRNYEDKVRTPLAFAAEQGNEVLLRHLLDAGANPTIKCKDGKTALDLAKENKHEACIRALETAKAKKPLKNPRIAKTVKDVKTPEEAAAALVDMWQLHSPDEIKTTVGEKALWKAIETGEAREVLPLFVKAGVNVNSKHENGDPLLHHVCRYYPGHVDLLLKAGADIHAVDRNGSTALFFASRATLRKLIKAGADVNAKNKQWGNTPLMHADSDDTDILLKAGADVRIQNNEGETVLTDAGPLTIKKLIAAGANLNQPDKRGVTPFMRIISYYSSGALCLDLIRAGADINAIDNNGETPLSHAGLAAAKALLENGANVNRCDQKGRTVLMHEESAFQPNTDKVKLLLEHGADANAKDKDGMTALMHLMCQKYFRDIELTNVQALLDAGCDINAQDNKGKTALIYLMEKNPQAKNTRYFPIMPVLECLLNHGADANLCDKQGRTALSLIPKNDKEFMDKYGNQMVEKLKAAGAKEKKK